MKRLATICARGGSKGLPGKNIKMLCGYPLLVYSSSQAHQSGLFDKIIVSSDDDEILAVAKNFGLETIKRPAALADDTASKIPTIVHAVKSAEAIHGVTFDTVVDLDVTSPLRLPEDIIGAVKLQEETGCSNVITGTPSHRSPWFNMVNENAQLIAQSDIVRRQDCPPSYDMNASVYVWNRDKFLAEPRLFYRDTKLYVMPKERSVDIDDEMDFKVVEMLMKKRGL